MDDEMPAKAGGRLRACAASGPNSGGATAGVRSDRDSRILPIASPALRARRSAVRGPGTGKSGSRAQGPACDV